MINTHELYSDYILLKAIKLTISKIYSLLKLFVIKVIQIRRYQFKLVCNCYFHMLALIKYSSFQTAATAFVTEDSSAYAFISDSLN